MAEERGDQTSLELPALFKRRSGRGAPDPGPRPPRSRPRLALPAMPAALLAGAITGLATVGLVWLALGACSSLRGTSSCGGPGVLVLVAIVVAMAVVGRVLLATLRVPEPGSTSVLGVALLAVTALVLADGLDKPAVAVGLVAAAAAAFAVAHWLTSHVSESGHNGPQS